MNDRTKFIFSLIQILFVVGVSLTFVHEPNTRILFSISILSGGYSFLSRIHDVIDNNVNGYDIIRHKYNIFTTISVATFVSGLVIYNIF